jgi:C-terminal processing protease CtpA/Prc
VGEKTWGKGTAQHVFRFEDGSALKLTVARYHLADGSNFPDREGLRPDLHVSRGFRADPRVELALQEARRAAPGDTALLNAIQGIASSEVKRTLPIPRAGDLEARRKSDPQLEAAWKVALAPN